MDREQDSRRLHVACAGEHVQGQAPVKWQPDVQAAGQRSCSPVPTPPPCRHAPPCPPAGTPRPAPLQAPRPHLQLLPRHAAARGDVQPHHTHTWRPQHQVGRVGVAEDVGLSLRGRGSGQGAGGVRCGQGDGCSDREREAGGSCHTHRRFCYWTS